MGLFESSRLRTILSGYLSRRRNSSPSLSSAEDNVPAFQFTSPPLVISSPVLCNASSIPQFTSIRDTASQFEQEFLSPDACPGVQVHTRQRRRSCPAVPSYNKKAPELSNDTQYLDDLRHQREFSNRRLIFGSSLLSPKHIPSNLSLAASSVRSSGDPPRFPQSLKSDDSHSYCSERSRFYAACSSGFPSPVSSIHDSGIMSRTKSFGDTTQAFPDTTGVEDESIREYNSVEGELGIQMTGRKLVMAVDFDDASAYAFRWMVRDQLRDGDRLHVVHVTESANHSSRSLTKDRFNKWVGKLSSKSADLQPILTLDEQRAAEKAILTDKLSHFVKENFTQACSGMNVHVVLHVVFGAVKKALITKIDELFPDLVVAGSRSNSRFPSFLMGSVSTFLVHNSLAPVVIARDPLLNKRYADKLKSKAVIPTKTLCENISGASSIRSVCTVSSDTESDITGTYEYDFSKPAQILMQSLYDDSIEIDESPQLCW